MNDHHLEHMNNCSSSCFALVSQHCLPSGRWCHETIAVKYFSILVYIISKHDIPFNKKVSNLHSLYQRITYYKN